MQNPLKILYPDQCVCCGGMVDGAGGLCAECWSETPFIDGLICDACGAPLLGDAACARPLCDDCLTTPPSWSRGRSVMVYTGNARSMVLRLKHGDRLDLARPAAGWMASRGHELNKPGTCLVPIPLHWTRLFVRKFNQAAVLSWEIGRIWGVDTLPDALIRTRRTAPQERMTRAERLANQSDAIRVNPARKGMLRGRRVLLVDDVMTTGATLSVAARALRDAGAQDVGALTLARVVKAS